MTVCVARFRYYALLLASSSLHALCSFGRGKQPTLDCCPPTSLDTTDRAPSPESLVRATESSTPPRLDGLMDEGTSDYIVEVEGNHVACGSDGPLPEENDVIERDASDHTPECTTPPVDCLFADKVGSRERHTTPGSQEDGEAPAGGTPIRSLSLVSHSRLSHPSPLRAVTAKSPSAAHSPPATALEVVEALHESPRSPSPANLLVSSLELSRSLEKRRLPQLAPLSGDRSRPFASREDDHEEEQMNSYVLASPTPRQPSQHPPSPAGAPAIVHRSSGSPGQPLARCLFSGEEVQLPPIDDAMELAYRNTSAEVRASVGGDSEAVATDDVATDAAEEAPQVLQPCQECDHPARYRLVGGYCCSYCTYTVCSTCFCQIPLELSTSDENDESSSDSADKPTTPSTDPLRRALESPSTAVRAVRRAVPFCDSPAAPRPPPTTNSTAAPSPSAPQCHLCQQGVLQYEDVLVHPWVCEGPRPAYRQRRGAGVVYDTDMIQRYYFLKDQRKIRGASRQPLVATFHGLVSDRAEGQPFAGLSGDAVTPQCVPLPSSAVPKVIETPGATSSDDPQRPPSCEEGRAFVFSVNNPRLAVTCVWCAINEAPRESHPAYTGSRDITPLWQWRCPPSLPTLAPRPYAVRIPVGVYGWRQVHAIALYCKEDLFLKAATQLTAKTSSRQMGGALRLLTVPPTSAIQPLLVVHILHRAASASFPLLRSLASPSHTATKSQRNDAASAATTPDAKRRRLDMKTNDSAEVHAWPEGGLVSEELALCVDHLLHGRSVAVYGLTSKHFFLHHVSHSADLGSLSLCVVDGSASSTSPVTILKQLREAQKKLIGIEERAQQRWGSRIATDINGLSTRLQEPQTWRCGGEQRSVAVPRDATVATLRATQAITAPGSSPVADAAAVDVCDVDSAVTPSASLPPHGRASESPPPTTFLQADSPAPCREGWSQRSSSGCVASSEVKAPMVWPAAQAPSMEDGATTPGAGRPAQFRAAFASSAVRASVLQHFARQRPPRCVRWKMLPSFMTLHIQQPSSIKDGTANPTCQGRYVSPLLLVVHSVDLLEERAMMLLQQLCRQYGAPKAHLQLLVSYDQPEWPLSSGAAALRRMRLAHVQLRSLWLPRVTELQHLHGLNLLLHTENASGEGGSTAASRTNRSLPLHDTMRRILFSLPAAFAELLVIMIAAQEEAGEGRPISLFAYQERFEQHGMMVSQGRLSALQKELTSNRLAVYDAAEHSLVIPQHRKLLKVLEEVAAQRQAGGEARGLANNF